MAIPFKTTFDDPFLDRPMPPNPMTAVVASIVSDLPGGVKPILSSSDASDSNELRSYLRQFRNPDVMLGVAAGCVEQGDMAEAVKWWQCAAGEKSAYAIHQLGLCCLHGIGLPFSLPDAVFWFTKGTELSHPPSLDLLGLCYKNGMGTDRDREYAAQLFARAAEASYAPAELNLGLCYFDGSGVARNDAQALRLIARSALQGHAPAQAAQAELEKFIIELEKRFVFQPEPLFLRTNDADFLPSLCALAQAAEPSSWRRITQVPESDKDSILWTRIWLDLNFCVDDRAIVTSPFKTTFDMLPLSLWARLFEFLPLSFTLNVATSLNGRFKNASMDIISHFSRINLSDIASPAVMDRHVQFVTSQVSSQHLRRIDLRRCPALSDAHLQNLSNAFPHLDSIQLQSCLNLSESAITSFICPRFQTLQFLSITHFNLSNLSTKLLPRLSELVDPLSSSSSSFSSTATFQRLNSSSCALQHFNLIDVPPLLAREADMTRFLFVLASSSYLQSIRFERGLSGGPAGADFVSDNVLRCMKRIPSLASLSIAGMCQFSELTLLDVMQALPNLTALDVSRCSQITDKFLLLLRASPAATRLRRFVCAHCPNISAQSLGHLMSTCTKLDSVSRTLDFEWNIERLGKIRNRFLDFTPLIAARLLCRAPDRSAPLFSEYIPAGLTRSKTLRVNINAEPARPSSSAGFSLMSPTPMALRTPSRMLKRTFTMPAKSKKIEIAYTKVELIWEELPPPPPSQRIKLFWKFLDLEVWNTIFSYLEFHTVFYHISRLSKDFYHHVFEDILPLRTSIHIDRAPTFGDTDSDRVLKILSRAVDTEHLSMAGMSSWSNDAFAHLLSQMPRLTELNLSRSTQLTNRTLEIIASSPCAIQLKSLSLRGGATFSEFGLSRLLLSCPQLTSLDVSLVFELSHDALRMLRHDLRQHRSISHSHLLIRLSESGGPIPFPRIKFVENVETVEEKAAKSRLLGFIEEDEVEEEAPPPPEPETEREPSPVPEPDEPEHIRRAKARLPKWYFPTVPEGKASLYAGQLPPSVFVQIFEFLPIHFVVQEARCLTQSFRRLLDRDVFRERFAVRLEKVSDESKIQDCVEWLGKHCADSLQKFTFVECSGLVDSHLISLPSHLPHVVDLCFERCANITDAAFVPMMAQLSLNLRSLQFKNLVATQHLTDMLFQVLLYAWDPEMTIVPRTDDKFQLLQYSTPDMSPDRIHELLLMDVPAALVGETVMVRLMKGLPRSMMTGSFNPRGIPNLTVLRFERGLVGGKGGADFVTDAMLEALAESEPHRLRELSLGGMRNWGDNALYKLLKESPSLTSLNLTRCTQVTDNTLNLILRSVGDQLKVLTIAHCFKVTDVSLVRMETMCPKLERIDINCVYSLTALGVKQFRFKTKAVVLHHMPM